MPKKLIIGMVLLSLFMFLAIKGQAVGEGISNYLLSNSILPVPSDPPVVKGGSVVNGNTGAMVSRVTSTADSLIDVPNLNIVYSRYSAENVDGNYLVVTGSPSGVWVYRTSDNIPIAKLRYGSGASDFISDVHEVRWDYTGNYPTRVYFVRGMAFYSMDILDQDRTRTLVHDFRNDYPDGYKIINDVEGDSSSNSRFWAFMVRGPYNGSAFPLLRIITYDAAENRILGSFMPTQGPTGNSPIPNMVEISPRGGRVITHYGRCWGATATITGPWTNEGNNVWSSPYKSRTAGNSNFNYVLFGGTYLQRVGIVSAGTAADVTALGQYANNSAQDKFYVWVQEGASPTDYVIEGNYGVRPWDIGSFVDGTYAWNLDFTEPVKISITESHSGWAFDKDGREIFISANTQNDWLEGIDIYTGRGVHIINQSSFGYYGGGIHIGKIYDSKKRGWVFISTYNPTNVSWNSNMIFMIELKDAAENPRIWRITPTYNTYSGSYWDESPAAISLNGKNIYWTANWMNLFGHREVLKTELPSNWHTILSPELVQKTISVAGSDRRIFSDTGKNYATIFLDGTKSSSAEGAIQNYTWREGTRVLATGPTAEVMLTNGTHIVLLEVSSATQTDISSVVISVWPSGLKPKSPVNIQIR